MNILTKAFNWLFKTDHQINHYIFGGNKGETISSRLGRYIQDNEDCYTCTLPARIFCRIVLAPLAWVLGQGTHHCEKSIQEEYRVKPHQHTWVRTGHGHYYSVYICSGCGQYKEKIHEETN